MKTKICKHCRSEIDKKAKVCPFCGRKQGSGLIRKFVGAFIVLIGLGLIFGGGNGGSNSVSRNVHAPKQSETDSGVKVTVIDFSEMTIEEIQAWAEENKIALVTEKAFSDSVPDGDFVSQSKDPGTQIAEGSTIKITYSLGVEPSDEYKNALKKAQSYSDLMHLSKERLFQQLTSEYGEKFDREAAKWAVDHVDADFYNNALLKAQEYSDTMYMSKNRIYSQLTSTYGENFTPEEAQYAVDNLVADYNKNALMTAKNYQSTMNMSKSAIYDQLVSSYGEGFTAEEAQYAIDHLSD